MVERVIAVLMERFGYGAYEGESVLTESEAEFIARKIVHVLEDLAEKEASQ
jgi:hypothetical protein